MALSEAHAGLRDFGVHDSLQQVDTALAQALVSPLTDDAATLKAYVGALPGVDVCEVPVDDAPLGPASVVRVGDVAVVHPGTGAVSLPEGSAAVAIDLRGLPEVPELAAALETALGVALSAPVPRPTKTVRSWHGNADQTRSVAARACYDFVASTAQPPYRAMDVTIGAADLPLAVLTGERLAPQAAEFAGALRVAGRAWIFGSDVFSSVAESLYSGVQSAGLVWRHADLSGPDGQRWPDVIAADGVDSDSTLASLPMRGRPSPIAGATASRARVEKFSNRGDPNDLASTLVPGEARAGLIIVHGALRQFFPYFDIVPDVIDARLEETMARVDSAPAPMDRPAFLDLLGRFAQAIHDGHSYPRDMTKPGMSAPLFLEESHGRAVVRRSGVAGLAPGDVIETIDGMAAGEWYRQRAQFTSGPTPGFLFRLITMNLLSAPHRLGARSLDGTLRTVEMSVEPAATVYEDYAEAPVVRPSGRLDDLGAPDVEYVNMSGAVTPDDGVLESAVREASGARAMIVDMRGYPARASAEYFLEKPVAIPLNTPVLSSPLPRDRSMDRQVIRDEPGLLRYTGPLVLLAGNATISAAETFALALVDSGRPLHVVGRTSGGSDGMNSGILLPGGFSFSFTAMQILHQDVSQFFDVGIVPDIPVDITPAGLAGGADPELAAALSSLTAPADSPVHRL